MEIFIAFFGFLLSVFGFSQILFPIFYTLPKLREFNRLGWLAHGVPYFQIIISPIIWMTILYIYYEVMSSFYSTSRGLIWWAYVASFIWAVIQLVKKNPKLEEDFIDSYGRFVKPKE